MLRGIGRPNPPRCCQTRPPCAASRHQVSAVSRATFAATGSLPTAPGIKQPQQYVIVQAHRVLAPSATAATLQTTLANQGEHGAIHAVYTLISSGACSCSSSNHGKGLLSLHPATIIDGSQLDAKAFTLMRLIKQLTATVACILIASLSRHVLPTYLHPCSPPARYRGVWQRLAAAPAQ